MSRQRKRLVEGEGLNESIPNGFDVIGDIAIVSIPAGYEDYHRRIADSITGRRRNVRTVLNRVSNVGGDYRVCRFEIIYGDPCTVTLHRESGFSYRLDLKESFFNPRLCTERMRVASMIKKDETIIVPFAGVGPFVIPAAAKGANVFAIEKNPSACRWLRENTGLNRVKDNVEAIHADAVDVLNIFSTDFDRAIIPTPYGFDESLFLVSDIVKTGGDIHFYTFKRPSEIEELGRSYERSGLEVRNVRRCGNVAKGVSRWVFDLRKE